MKKIGLVLLLILTSDIYSKPHNEYILHAKPNKTIKLIEPPLEQRKGAIRGVPIRFRVLSKQIDLEYELINPPKGMMILGRSDLGEWEIGKTDGVDVLWNVPMDIEEKIYTINMKATDFARNEGTLSFDIKVPKTTIISTKIENNELIVIDKNSNLYGMKMKGHNGEDVSQIKLRSVNYTDVWKYIPKDWQKGKQLEYIVFIIDNKPPQLDIDLSDDIYIGFYRYQGDQFHTFNAWNNIARGYTRNTDGTFTPFRNEYDNGGNKVYLVVIEQEDI